MLPEDDREGEDELELHRVPGFDREPLPDMDGEKEEETVSVMPLPEEE